MTPHINAKDGAFAKTVLMPGDPLRAKLLADTFLENAELVTDVRNIYGYTGTYKGVPVSVMASGMGMPSIGIYSWELFSFYGVENIIRIGSAGSYSAQLEVLDVVLAKEAYSESSFAKTLSGYDKDTIVPYTMSEELYKKHPDKIRYELFPGADHGMSYIIDKPRYQRILKEFLSK